MSKEKIDFTCTAAEKKAIQDKAESLNMSVAGYIKLCTLNARVDIQVGRDPIPYLIRDAFRMFEAGLITVNEFQDMKFKIKNGSGRRALEGVNNG